MQCSNLAKHAPHDSCPGVRHNPLPRNIVMMLLQALMPLLIVILIRALIEQYKRRQ
jgi:hypothetical protein